MYEYNSTYRAPASPRRLSGRSWLAEHRLLRPKSRGPCFKVAFGAPKKGGYEQSRAIPPAMAYANESPTLCPFETHYLLRTRMPAPRVIATPRAVLPWAAQRKSPLLNKTFERESALPGRGGERTGCRGPAARAHRLFIDRGLARVAAVKDGRDRSSTRRAFLPS